MTVSGVSAESMTLADGLTIGRMGYGAMQLAGPNVFGPPRDRDQAIAVLREAVELGVTHIDTADFYGPVVTNELIRQTLSPYPEGLHIATKVGARRGEDGSWHPALAPDDLKAQVRENLQHLGLDVLDVVYLRLGSPEGASKESTVEQFGVLADLRQDGLIRHLGLSGASSAQLNAAQGMAPVVMVQNLYNLANRYDDPLIDQCASENIAYVPFFPLGGFNPLQHATLNAVAARLDATPSQVSLAWLLQRSPAIALIPGTSSLDHLRENIAAADLKLPDDAVAELGAIGW